MAIKRKSTTPPRRAVTRATAPRYTPPRDTPRRDTPPGGPPPRAAVPEAKHPIDTAVDEPASPLKTPQRVAVDALFQNEANLRQAIRENLTTLRPASDAVAKRGQEAFAAFNPSNLSTAERARRHYVAPGTDPYETLEAVVVKGTDAIRSSRVTPTITLRNNTELKKLIKKDSNPTDSLRGVVELGPLIDFISSKSTGTSLVTESTSTLCKADLQADKILDVVENPPKRGNGDDAANSRDSSSETGEADQLVNEHVNRQMKSATAPESQLAYGKIPNSADQDKVQSGILQTFQLRPGASDVTSYHDFHTLQIAFQHVWTEIFDGKLAALGRDLYGEYVKLKDFSGSGQPDLKVSTIADLRRLMDEIKKLSQIVEEKIPPKLKDGGGRPEDNESNGHNKTLEDVGRGILGAATLGMSEVAIAIYSAFKRDLQKINWDSFNRPLPGGRGDTISVETSPGVASPGYVWIYLKTDANSWKKQIEFQNFDGNRFKHHTMIGNWGGMTASMSIPKDLIKDGLLEFDSEGKPDNFETQSVAYGRYLLNNLGEKLEDRMSVTFHWKGVN